MKQVLLFLSCLLLCVGCQNKPLPSQRTITVTIEPLRYFTERIAGNRFTVHTMVPAGSNPETFEPTATQMQALAQSDIYIKVGEIGFEQSTLKRILSNTPHTFVVDASRGIPTLATTHHHGDPHTWMSCKNARQIAQNIYAALVKTDSADSLFYRHNLTQFLSEIAHVDSTVRHTLAKSKAKAFLIYHPSLTYFAHDYGLKQITIEEEGREPSARQLQHVVQEARKQGVRTLFIQKEFAARNVDVVAQSLPLIQTEINPLSYQWAKEMVETARKLR